MSEAPSGCPVKHDGKFPISSPTTSSAAPTACPVAHDRAKAVFLPNAPAFPAARVIHEESGAGIVGDVFPDSKRHPEQRMFLSNIPSQSNIPKSSKAPNPAAAPPPPPPPVAEGNPPPPLACTSDAATIQPPIPASASPPNTADTWTFPSQQRFYNAMKKKGWNPREEDMRYVVSIHNTINEQTWRRVMEYEKLHASECKNPTLLRFQGLPTDYSIKARLKSAMGYVLPFDRHDWTIDRCGKEVKYVIDFYQGPENADPRLPAAVHLDVRPAPNTVGNIIDRARVWVNNWFTV